MLNPLILISGLIVMGCCVWASLKPAPKQEVDTLVPPTNQDQDEDDGDDSEGGDGSEGIDWDAPLDLPPGVYVMPPVDAVPA